MLNRTFPLLMLALASMAICPAASRAQSTADRQSAVERHVSALVQRGTALTPVSLLQPVADQGSARESWRAACRQAEVLRYDRSAADRLLADPPAHIALTIPSGEGPIVLDLYKADVLATDLVVRAASTGGRAQLPASAHYRGVIRGQAGSIAAVSVFPDEMMVLMSDAGGERIVGRLGQALDDLLILYRADDLLAQHRAGCATPDGRMSSADGQLRDGTPTTLRCVRWHWEVSFDIFQEKGSVANAANYAMALFNQSATLFADDGISVALQELVVWDIPDPYGGANSQEVLESFQDHISTINGDMGHLLDLGLNGGIAANIASLCATDVDERLCYSGIESTFNNVPVYSWSVYVVTHEQGHLMGSFHTHACVWNGNNTAIDGCATPEGSCPAPPVPMAGTIMSYCGTIDFGLGFGPQPAQAIRDHVNSSSCLFSCGTGACDSLSIVLNTVAGAGVVLDLSVANVPLMPFTGDSIATCLTAGCYLGAITDGNGTPVDGTYTVTDANGNSIASGTTTNAAFAFTLGTIISGCTDPAADNYDPNATCDDGSCCTTLLTLVLEDAGGDGWEGALYALVSAQGDTAFSGTLSSGSGDTLTFCPPVGCYAFHVSAGSDPAEIAWALSGEWNESGLADTTINVTMGGAVIGCMDPSACNFNPNATCPGTCSYGEPSLIIIGASLTPEDVSWALVEPGGAVVSSGNGEGGQYPGCLTPACGYTLSMTDGAGAGWDQGFYVVIIGTDTIMGTLEDGALGVDTLNFGPQAGCMDQNACNYDPLATCAGTCVATPTWFADADGDGYGILSMDSVVCAAPVGYVSNAFDCDDAQPTVNPFALEICDGLDNDCDGLVDEEFIWYADQDEDGFGDNATAQVSCAPVPGAVQQGGDCDDNDATITTPGAVCDDGDANTTNDLLLPDCTCLGTPIGQCPPGEIQDCNGNCAPADWVGDGFCDNGAFEYNGAVIFFNCAQFNDDEGDCAGCTTEICDGIDNDCDFEIDEGFVEICNGLDDDCDGDVDEGIAWLDADGDGFGDADAPVICSAPGAVANSLDCDDTDPVLAYGIALGVFTDVSDIAGTAHYTVTQGSTVLEGDIALLAEEGGFGLVNLCLGAGCFSVQVEAVDEPLYFESYLGLSHAQGNTIAFPTAQGYQGPASGQGTEVCNGIDDDCDGQVDEGLPQQFADNDGDGFGNPLEPLPCDTPGVANADDCNDNDPLIGAGACGNCSAADQLWIAQNQETIDAIVGAEIFNCINSGDLEGCLATALLNGTPLQNSCVTCIAQRYSCILSSCLTACLGGFENASCQACIQANCNAAYFACAGFTDADGDGVVAEGDCDDNNAAIYPGATELCDGLDNDCDGSADEGIVITYYSDADVDGYGDDATALNGDCDAPPGSVTTGGDCDDTDNTIFPGAPELCDNIDNNCDGAVDNNAGTAYYTDADADGFGDDATETFSCTPIPGMITQGGDCNDSNLNIHPGAPDPCDELDQNCSGGPVLTTWYQDSDGDGYGTDAVFMQDCIQPIGFVPTSGDCDDANASVFPGQGCGNCSNTDQQWLATHQQELIDAMGACAGQCFDDPACLVLCMQDQGIPLSALCLSCVPAYVTCLFDNCMFLCLNSPDECMQCQVQSGCVAQLSTCMGMVDTDGDGWWAGSDCNDANAAIYPGAVEACDGLDNDCDGSIDEGLSFTYYTDADDDGFGLDGTGVQGDCEQPPGTATQAGDCDDADDTIFPGAPELCDNFDNNCDGITDNEAGIAYYTDADGDGYGDDVTMVLSCTPIPNTVTVGGDCNDADAAINPGAADPCDSIDQDCSGGPVITTWYQDLDNDDFGNTNVTLNDCVQPVGYVALNGDCDDTNANLFPGNGCGNCTLPEQQWLAANQVEFQDAMNQCLFQCFFDGPECISSCMQNSGIPVGTVCLTCVEDFVTCWQTNCLMECLNGEEACYECQLQSGCTAQLVTCLGMVDADGDGWWQGSDCNDNNSAIYPGAPESCNGIDDDCDGTVDNDAGDDYYPDADGDGYGDDDAVVLSCTPIPGMLTAGGDCDDTDPLVNPLGTEACNGFDDNCDGQVDEGLQALWYNDLDGDGFGDPSTEVFTCDPPQGYIAQGGDCHDGLATVYPGAPELCDGFDNDCDGGVDNTCVLVAARVLLEGPYNPGTGLMNDGMRALGLVPTTEPYTGLGYTHVGGGGGETTSPVVLAVSGSDAIVDWVLLELRDAINPAIIVASRSALLQRDGDVVDTDGTSAVSMFLGQGNYYVAVRHRNHLGAMTLSPIFLFQGQTTLDFSLSSTATYGTEACRIDGALQLLWCGDVTFDGVVKYTGLNNDRDPILIDIGGTVPTNTVSGYQDTDVNMDGTVKYTGGANDRDPILITVGGTVPTAVRVQQLP